jgi:TonB family protein
VARRLYLPLLALAMPLFFSLPGSAAAQDGTPLAVTSSDAVVQSWALNVRDRVVRSAIRHKGPTAAAAVGFTLVRDGSIVDIRVLDASDDRAAALAAQVVREAAPFPPMPGAVSADAIPFTIKIRFAGAQRAHRRHG